MTREVVLDEKTVIWSFEALPVTDIMERWVPGSQDQPWTWDDEAADLDARTCCCRSHECDPDRPNVVASRSKAEGHYQRMIEEKLAAEGQWWDALSAPILGTDGRVWDGHHRIIAAHRLGIERLRVEVAR